MNISNTLNAYLTGSDYTSTNNDMKFMPQSGAAGPSNSGSKDKVTLSAEGMKASNASHDQGIEKFRLPSWFGQYLPKQNDLSISSQAVEETRQLFQMHDEFYSDGKISADERQALNNYRSNSMSANQTMRDQFEFQSKHKNELEEYGEKFNSYYAAAREEHGITPRNYFEKVLQVEGDNESLHQSVKKKLLEDPRALELMDILGIKRPV